MLLSDVLNLERRICTAAGIVYEDIETPVSVDRCANDPVDVRKIGYISFNSDDMRTFGP